MRFFDKIKKFFSRDETLLVAKRQPPVYEKIPRTVRLYDRSNLKVGQTFKMSDGKLYTVAPDGSFRKLRARGYEGMTKKRRSFLKKRSRQWNEWQAAQAAKNKEASEQAPSSN